MPEAADSRTRIYVLARELGEQPKEVLERAQRLGFPVTTVLHSLDPMESSRVSDSFSDLDVRVQPDVAAAPDGNAFPSSDRDAVTTVTIISVEGEATVPGEASAVPRPQDSFSVVEAPGSPQTIDEGIDDTGVSPDPTGEDVTADVDPATVTAEPAALLRVVKDGGAEEWVAQENDQRDEEAVVGEAVEEEIEGPVPSDERLGAVAGDPWHIDAVLAKAPTAPEASVEAEAPRTEPAAVDSAEGDVAEGDVVAVDGQHVAEGDVVEGDVVAVDGQHVAEGDVVAGDVVAVDGQHVAEGDVVAGDGHVAEGEPAEVELAEVEPAEVEPAEVGRGVVAGSEVADDVSPIGGGHGPAVGLDGEQVPSAEGSDVVADESDTPGSTGAERVDDEQPAVGPEPALETTQQDLAVAVVPAGVDEPYVGEVRERRWPWRFGVAVWALLIVAVAVGGAVITATNLPDVRRAESDVIVRLSGFDFSEIDRQLDSYVVVAESETVIGPAAREIGMSPLDLRDAMTVGLIGDSAVIRFGVEDVNEGIALAANTALVQQYLSVVNTPADESLLVFIDGEIDGVRASLVDIESSLGTLAVRRSDNAARRAGLVATQETLRGRLVSLYARRTDIQTGAAVPGTSIGAIQAEIDDLQEQLDTVTSEVELIESADATDALAEAQLFSEQGALRSELSRLEDRRVGLGIDQLGQARARVLTSPHMIADSVTPTAARGGAFGLAVGLILALVFVVFVSRLRQRQ